MGRKRFCLVWFFISSCARISVFSRTNLLSRPHVHVETAVLYKANMRPRCEQALMRLLYDDCGPLVEFSGIGLEDRGSID